MKNIIRSNNGTALFVALLAVVIMSGLSILMIKRGTFGMQDTVRVRNVQSAFTAAEAGIEHARKLLNDGAVDTWDDELLAQAGADAVMNTGDDVNFIVDTSLNSRQSYTVRISDNTDIDPSLLVDADGRIWVTSTGSSGVKTSTIKTLMENNSQDAHLAQEHYGEQSLGHAKSEGRDVVGQTRGNM